MAPAIVIASICAALYGRYYDKKGYVKSILPALAALCLGYILIFFFKTMVPVFIGSLLAMIGFLCGSTVFGAMLRDKTPQGKAGMFQGLRIVCQVLIPGVIGPSVGAWVLRNADVVVNNDGTTSFIPNENIFMASLIVAVVLIAYVLIISASEKSKKTK